MRKTVCLCDFCGAEFQGKGESSFLASSRSLDACPPCVRRIVLLAIEDGVVAGKNLRPFCPACGGSGTVLEDEEVPCHDRPSKRKVKCGECLP